MEKRAIGNQGLVVSALGLGCMGMSDFYGTPDERDETDAMATLHHALAIGVTFWDTADMYGPYTNEELLGRALAGRRDQAIVATKFGFQRQDDGTQRLSGRPEYVQSACDASLTRLGVDHIDLYYQHRVDRTVPIEETVGAMGELVHAGKVRYLGLSEASAATVERAHAVHPISAVQSEYSLFARDVEASVLPLLRRLGIGFVAYSPLGRGILGGAVSTDTLAASDARRSKFPRYVGANLDHNLELIRPVTAIAERLGATPAQVALAWLLHQGDDVVPIPGTKRRARLDENAAAAALTLSPVEVAELAAAIPADAVAGQRHWDMASIDG